jgi:hypothetical protein
MFLSGDEVSMAKAKPGPAISPLRPEFDEFLYSPIGESNSDMSLSVLSMLARQNLDPWEEAAHLAQLSQESAVARLTTMISPAAAGPSAASAPETATRLIGTLPRRDSSEPRPLYVWPGEPLGHIPPIITYLVIGAIIVASSLLGN